MHSMLDDVVLIEPWFPEASSSHLLDWRYLLRNLRATGDGEDHVFLFTI